MTGWHTLDPHIRQIAENHCTHKELTALKLWHNGAGYRRVALILGISMSTARGRIHRAIDRIVIQLEKEERGSLAHSLREPNRPATERTH